MFSERRERKGRRERTVIACSVEEKKGEGKLGGINCINS